MAALALVAALGGVPVDAALTEQQARGKQVYQKGTSTSGSEISAILGSEGVVLPASMVPCASCHGPDGRGRPEGGLIPPDIRWSELTKAYGHVHESGRRHPAFDQASLARIVRTGLDPAHNRLDQAMPTYQMSDADMADMFAYLQVLEDDWDSGLSDDAIQLGTLLPLSGPRGSLGQAMAQVMYAHFQQINERGGIFGRRIELLAIPYGDSPEATLATLRKAFEKEGIFALVGAYTVGLETEILDVLRVEQVPLIGPFTLNPGDEIVDAAAFYLYPGFVEQARVLANQALDDGQDGAAPLLLVGPNDGRVGQLIAAVQDQLRARHAAAPTTLNYRRGALDAQSMAVRVQQSESDAMIFLGEQSELDAVLAALAEREQHPRVYLLSSFVPRPLFDVPAAFHNRIFLAYPTLGSDVSATGRSEYQRLAESHALPPDHLQGQIAAFAAAKLLVEGLRRAGRTLNRHALVEALEALYTYDTGLTPPLTYGPNRRIGARGAHVMAVDLKTRSYETIGGWHELR